MAKRNFKVYHEKGNPLTVRQLQPVT